MIAAIEEFLIRWGEPFRKVHEGLNLLSGYPSGQMGTFHPGEQISFDQRIARQHEWHRNLYLMDDIDKVFFQQHWVPVQEDLAQWFIDLSDPGLPVFSTYFFEPDPRSWHRNPITDSLSEFILAMENGDTRENLVKLESQGQLEIFRKETLRRTDMIFSGEIETSPVTIAEIFFEGKVGELFAPPDTNDFFLFNTNPLAIGIIHPETKISLNSVKCEYQNDEIADMLERITIIGHFIHFLRLYGQENFPDFQLDLIDSEVAVFYNEEKQLIVIGLDEVARQDLIKRAQW